MYVPRYSATLRMNLNGNSNSSIGSNMSSVEKREIQSLLQLKKIADNVLSGIDPDRIVRYATLLIFLINSAYFRFNFFLIFGIIFALFSPYFWLIFCLISSCRITIDGGVSGTSVYTAIGRTAHTCYLENAALVSQLIGTLLPYFE